MSNTVSGNAIPYPWQQQQWQGFLQQAQQGRLPHALLLTGQPGIGKRHYARAMANYLLCQSPVSGLACGKCRSCQLLQADSHPDKRLVAVEEKAKQIKIDQIRQLSPFIAETAQQGGLKVIILEPVERLNINAANALLKNLEEPPGDTYFILVSDIISGVMPTIRSRCQLLRMPLPEKAVAVEWLRNLGYTQDLEHVLALTAGTPLGAQRLLSEPVVTQLTTFYQGLARLQQAPGVDIELAGDWREFELGQLLDWWFQLVYGLTVDKQQSVDTEKANTAELDFIQAMASIRRTADSWNRQWLYRFAEKLLQIKGQLLNGANPNSQLLLEELLLDWYAIINSNKTVEVNRL